MACRNMSLAENAMKNLANKYDTKGKLSMEELDVSQNESIDRFARTIKDKYPSIDVLVNNAGYKEKPNAFSE